MDLTKIVKKPIITEKTTSLANDGYYVFLVDKKANRPQIAQAIKKIYKVDSEKINIINFRGKVKRRMRQFGFRPGGKKAIVKIKKGQKISDFEIKEK